MKRNNDFKKVFEKGKYFQKNFIKIKYLKNGLDKNQFGLIVGIKISKKAVERNRIKRWVEEIIHLNSDQIKTGFNIIIMFNPDIIEKKYSQVEEELINLLKESKIWNL